MISISRHGAMAGCPMKEGHRSRGKPARDALPPAGESSNRDASVDGRSAGEAGPVADVLPPLIPGTGHDALPRFGEPVIWLAVVGAPDAPDCVVVAPQAAATSLQRPALAALASRIQEVLQHPMGWRDTILRVGPLSLDLLQRVAFRDGRTIDLLPREFKLLEYMMRRPGQVVSRGELLRDVWNFRFMPETNVVDVHLGKLRRKVDAPGETPLFRAVRGAGFTLISDAGDS